MSFVSKVVVGIQYFSGILLLLSSFHPGVSAAEFTFGTYTDDTCSTIKTGLGGTPGPWTFDSAQCNTWASTIPNSIKVTSCSSTCVCFEQSANSDSCAQAGNVKESCTNKCMKDDQGSWLQISGFSGCGELQVPDSEYSCGCTKMNPNDVCTTASSGGGNSSPTTAPAPTTDSAPTPGKPTSGKPSSGNSGSPDGSKPSSGNSGSTGKPESPGKTSSDDPAPTKSLATRCSISTLLFTVSLVFAVALTI